MNDFQRFAPFTQVAKQPDGTIYCHSVVHDEAPDQERLVIDYDGGKAAIDEFMQWANVREMHGETAAGVVDTVIHHDDQRMSEAVLHVVDPVAVMKVETGVYKGTSWGGYKGSERELTQVAGHDATRLMHPTFIELSLVDRPSRPTAVLTLMQRAEPGPVTEGATMRKRTPGTATVSRENTPAATATAPANEPLQQAAADDLLGTHVLEESLARMIEEEAGEDAPSTARIEKYKIALAALQEADTIAAGELGTPSDTTEAAEDQAELEDDLDDSDASTTTVILAAAAKPGDLRQAGARNNAQDQALIDQIVANGIALGGNVPAPVDPKAAAAPAAAVPPPAAPAPAAPIAQAAGIPTLDQIADRLAQAGGFVRKDELAQAMKAAVAEALEPMQKDVAKIAAQPAPGGPLRSAKDAHGILGQAAAGPTSLDDVLEQVSRIADPRQREEIGRDLAVAQISAIRRG